MESMRRDYSDHMRLPQTYKVYITTNIYAENLYTHSRQGAQNPDKLWAVVNKVWLWKGMRPPPSRLRLGPSANTRATSLRFTDQ